jgi:hypothetical protein
MPSASRTIPSSTLLEQIEPLRQQLIEARREMQRGAMMLSRDLRERDLADLEAREEEARAMRNEGMGLVRHATTHQDPREMYAAIRAMREEDEGVERRAHDVRVGHALKSEYLPTLHFPHTSSLQVFTNTRGKSADMH